MNGFSNKYKISKYAIIRKGRLITDAGQFEFPDVDDDAKFLKNIYKQLKIDYPKFYKMDRLCKLAFLTAEYLFKEKEPLKKYDPGEVALIFSNSNSSLDTDIKHNDSIADKDKFFPKPAVFVYTLPNIMMGELSIRHFLRGENIFFVSEKFDTAFITDYTVNLLNTTRHKACIIGWVDYLEKGFESALFFIESANQNKQGDLLTTENLDRKFYTFARL